MPEAALIGWDVGGAHLKAARLDRDGQIGCVLQLPCPLWRGLDRLDAAMAQALWQLGPAPRHALTMTGEMADIFPSRAAGVRALIEAARASLGDRELAIFAGRSGFLDPRAASACWREVASANWRATATFVAGRCEAALLVDIGSTTTDIAPVAAGRVLAKGRGDFERLRAEELVYTGVVRTPVMAVASSIVFEGKSIGLMAELFATMADAYRLAMLLPEEADQSETADGAGRSPTDSARRLARMLGCDAEDRPLEVWRTLAVQLIERQAAHLESACARVAAEAGLERKAPLVAAGCGRFLVAELARRTERPWLDFADLAPVAPAARYWAGSCAPAVAVACLANAR